MFGKSKQDLRLEIIELEYQLGQSNNRAKQAERDKVIAERESKRLRKKLESSLPLNCSFCGKAQDDVKTLIAGPNTYICDECVDLCARMVRERRSNEDAT